MVKNGSLKNNSNLQKTTAIVPLFLSATWVLRRFSNFFLLEERHIGPPPGTNDYLLTSLTCREV